MVYKKHYNKWYIPLFALVLFLISCNSDSRQARDQAIFRYNEASGISTLDPAFARDQSVIWPVNQLYNGLVQLDDQMQICPCLADAWEISGDGREYVFHLRKDVSFHKDPCFKPWKTRTVIAADFVYSFTRILDPETASPGAWIFDFVERSQGKARITARDDSTLVIMLNKPFPPFLSMLSMPYASVVPREAVSAYRNDFRKHPVGTGPFMLKYWKEGVKLVMVRNPDYFEMENGKRLPFLEAVNISFLADKQSAFLEFIKGRLDFLSGLDPSYKDELLDHNGNLRSDYKVSLRLITQPYLNTEYLGFLLRPGMTEYRKNPLQDKRIRQAINLGFDRRKMIRYLRNNVGSPGIHGIIPPGLPAFDSSRVYFDYDPDSAAALLRQAGFPGGKGLPPLVLSSTPDYLDFCKHIQQQLNELGIELKIEISTPAAIKEMKAEARLSFFRASWIADYPDAENYLLLFLSRNFCPRGPNYTHFSNQDFDRLYELAMKEPDETARSIIYRKMENIVMEEAPVVVLYYDQVLRFVHREVKGLGCNAINLLALKHVSISR